MEEHMSKALTAAVVAVGAIAGATAASAKDLTIPKGTYLELKSASAFDSEHASKGDTFEATVDRALWVDGQLAIPAGSTVRGEIKSVHSPRDGAKSAAMGVKFESMTAGGRTYDIEGVLVSLKADERKKIIENQGRIATGRKVDVILIGSGTEADMKVDTLVGISGADRDDLADEWSKSGLGPATLHVSPGTSLTMQFDKTLPMTATSGRRADGDRNIVTSADTVRNLQRVLKGRSYYAGEATGSLDQSTRDALARFQLDQRQPATGDADEATVQALGVTTAGNHAK
jgi:hypothetical protein